MLASLMVLGRERRAQGSGELSSSKAKRSLRTIAPIATVSTAKDSPAPFRPTTGTALWWVTPNR